MTQKEKALVSFLSGFITGNKLALFNKILSQRTRFLTVVLEDIYQPQNASAVVRSCDCFGIQDLHIIENRNEYVINPAVTLGSAKWVDIIRYNEGNYNTTECINRLKSQNYKIVATTPSESASDLNEFALTDKTALFFGTELTGLSEEVIKQADENIRIPMYGFTESFNISVSVALVLFSLRQKLQNSDIDFLLSPDECELLKLEWIKRVIKKSDQYIEEFEKSWNEKVD